MDGDDHERDAATQAFEDVRGELALLRRAIEGIAAARDDRPDPPDYGETLGQITKLANATYQRAELLRKAAEEETVARQVAARITGAVAEDRQAVKIAAGELRDATRALQGVTVSARRGNEQNRWLAWTAIGATAFGILLWAAFAGAVARAVPESWLWPERMAARTLRLDAWDASRRLAGVSRPETWNTMVRGAIMMQENEAAIERCRRAATKAREAVLCTVRIAPGAARRER